jgi:hypothetical protein
MFALIILGCLAALVLYVLMLRLVTDENREIAAQERSKRKVRRMFPLDSIKTGPDLERVIETRLAGSDWQAQLAERSGMPRDEIVRHLRQTSAPPGRLLTAARELLGDAAEAQDAGAVTTGSSSTVP